MNLSRPPLTTQDPPVPASVAVSLDTAPRTSPLIDPVEDNSTIESSSTLAAEAANEVPKEVTADKKHVDLLVDVGTRVQVFWEKDGAYVPGEIRQHRPNTRKPFLIAYDNGQEEWIDLDRKVWGLAEKKCSSDDKPAKKRKVDNPIKTDHYGVSNDKVSPPSTRDNAEKVARKRTAKNVCSDDENWVAAGALVSRESDSDTDEEEVLEWARNMLGVPPAPPVVEKDFEPDFDWDAWGEVLIPISEKVKLGRRRGASSKSNEQAPRIKIKKPKNKKKRAQPKVDPEEERLQREEEERKRKKEEARPLTAAEVKAILGEEEFGSEPTNWVRRSARQPSRAILTSPLVSALVEGLTGNEPDMVVLKMKKYIQDPDAPQVVIDTALDALEENTNCQALYIQNFNVGMQDAQVLRLLQILQRPSCNIWCLNIGETYRVRSKTWRKFARGLARTKVTHMYASEHTISTELKDRIRATIRDNRAKHTMHCDPDNLDVIVQCTHCWWNPINTKSLQPYITKRGYDEAILKNKEVQGLKGTMSGANLK